MPLWVYNAVVNSKGASETTSNPKSNGMSPVEGPPSRYMKSQTNSVQDSPSMAKALEKSRGAGGITRKCYYYKWKKYRIC